MPCGGGGGSSIVSDPHSDRKDSWTLVDHKNEDDCRRTKRGIDRLDDESRIENENNMTALHHFVVVVMVSLSSLFFPHENNQQYVWKVPIRDVWFEIYPNRLVDDLDFDVLDRRCEAAI